MRLSTPSTRSLRPRPVLVVLLGVAAAGTLIVGCASEAPRQSSQRPNLQTPWSEPGDLAQRPAATRDACADRLHDLCHPILLHYAVYRRLPASLHEMQKIAGPDPAVVFECPLSKQPYGYNAHGLVAPTVPGRIVLYDSTPTHGGKRWAVILEDTKPGQPLIPRVVSIAEAEFPSRPIEIPATRPADN